MPDDKKVICGISKTRTRTVRPIIVSGDVAYIQLTRGFVSIIDAEDVDLVSSWNWMSMVGPWSVYAHRMAPKDTNGKRKSILLHRVITGATDGTLVDHISGDCLDNRKQNLRFATPSQNSFNQKIRSDSASGVKGVRFDRHRGKWAANIRANGKRYYLGRFDTLDEAKKSYDYASKRYHGEFCRS